MPGAEHLRVRPVFFAPQRGAATKAQVAPGGTCHALLLHSPPLISALSARHQAVQPFGLGCVLDSVPPGRRVFQQGVKTPRLPGGSFFRWRVNEGESS